MQKLIDELEERENKLQEKIDKCDIDSDEYYILTGQIREINYCISSIINKL